MAKVTLPQQHQMLEQYWPGDCCLCRYEQMLKDLEKQLKKTKAKKRRKPRSPQEGEP